MKIGMKFMKIYVNICTKNEDIADDMLSVIQGQRLRFNELFVKG